MLSRKLGLFWDGILFGGLRDWAEAGWAWGDCCLVWERG